MTIFSMRLRQAFETSGMTQRVLAQKCGISEVSLSQYLSGAHTPRLSKVPALAIALGVSPEYLLGTETPANQKRLPVKSATDESVPDWVVIPRKISVRDAAALMGVGETYIKDGLILGAFNPSIGEAMRGSGGQWRYRISPELLKLHVSPVVMAEYYRRKHEQRQRATPLMLKDLKVAALM